MKESQPMLEKQDKTKLLARSTPKQMQRSKKSTGSYIITTKVASSGRGLLRGNPAVAARNKGLRAFLKRNPEQNPQPSMQGGVLRGSKVAVGVTALQRRRRDWRHSLHNGEFSCSVWCAHSTV